MDQVLHVTPVNVLFKGMTTIFCIVEYIIAHRYYTILYITIKKNIVVKYYISLSLKPSLHDVVHCRVIYPVPSAITTALYYTIYYNIILLYVAVFTVLCYAALYYIVLMLYFLYHTALHNTYNVIP